MDMELEWNTGRWPRDNDENKWNKRRNVPPNKTMKKWA